MQAALNILAFQRMRASRFFHLNDPFELICVKEYGDVMERTKSKIGETRGLLSFSNRTTNPVLWSHYAERHTGIALGFDVADGMRQPVTYQDKFLEMEFDPATGRPSIEFVNRFHSTKFLHWQYEDEVRCFVDLDPDEVEDGKHYVPFSEALQLREIILGPLCPWSEQNVAKLAAKGNLGVVVRKAGLSKTAFEVR